VTRLRHIALFVLVLLGGQMAAPAIASAAPCCPAMAGSDAPASPCESVAALGCCESPAPSTLPEPPVPPPAPAPASAIQGAIRPADLVRAPSPVATAAARALRLTILRL
jgi:hypothetical protein